MKQTTIASNLGQLLLDIIIGVLLLFSAFSLGFLMNQMGLNVGVAMLLAGIIIGSALHRHISHCYNDEAYRDRLTATFRVLRQRIDS